MRARRTDDKDMVGKHVWEIAGLGKAPYRYISCEEKLFKSGDTVKPGGSCHYCCTAITMCFTIESADGKRFIVGSDCVERIGELGLVKQFKSSPEYRAFQAKKRHERALNAAQETRNLIDKNKDALADRPHPRGFVNRETGSPLTMLDYAEWMMENAGDSGKTSLGKYLRRELNILN